MAEQADLQPPAGTPANIAPYVQVLGVDGAVEFLLAFGGAELYLSPRAKDRSRVVRLVGRAMAMELAAHADRLPARVPTAKPWIAARLKDRGLSIQDIARTLHASDVAVRGWVRNDRQRLDARQLPLFED